MASKEHIEWCASFSGHVDPEGKANCKGLPIELMYEKATTATAEQICFGCVCLNRCRCYAVWSGEPDGIWGGMNALMRAAYRRIHTRRAR